MRRFTDLFAALVIAALHFGLSMAVQADSHKPTKYELPFTPEDGEAVAKIMRESGLDCRSLHRMGTMRPVPAKLRPKVENILWYDCPGGRMANMTAIFTIWVFLMADGDVKTFLEDQIPEEFQP